MASSSTNVDNPVNQIASLLAGDAQPPKKETLKAVETEETLTLEEPDESLETADSQPQDESLAEEEESAESSDEEESAIDTLNNLAEELEIDIADMYALNVKLSRGENLPEGGKITLGELKTFYEKNADIETLRSELTKRETELQTQSESVSEVPKVSNELLQARAQVLAIQDQYNRTNWQGLRHENPAEYAALQNDFHMQFELAKANEAQATNAVETHLQESRRQQQERLFEALPELKDAKRRAEVAAEVQTFVGRYGITPKDLEKVEDSRVMRLLIEASRSDKAKTTAKEKKVDSTPASNKPSASRPVPSRNAALKRLTERAKATGQIKDQAAAVAALLGGKPS